MAKKRMPLGRAELAILQYVSENHPIRVRDVAEYAARTGGQARTTVLTVMERLRKKGYLLRKRIDGVWQYSPKISQTELLKTLVGDFVDGVLGGSVSPLMAYMAESSQLTPEQICSLRELVDSFESGKKGDSK